MDDQTDDGLVEFSAGLGETRFIIGLDPDGTVVVNESDRLEAEYPIFVAPAVDTVERFLLMTFGATTRFRRSLRRIRFPADGDGVAPGFTLATRPFRGEKKFALVTTDGQTVAWSRNDRIIATVVLVELSYHMRASIAEIAASYIDPAGLPLFESFVR